MRYFSSDFHLGSKLINEYAHRPWLTAHEAALDIISNVNSTCRDDDILIHCGDFSLQSTDRHGEVEDVPIPKSTREWLWSFMPSVFLLQGNHDTRNADESMAKSMTVDLSPSWRNVYVSHYPSGHDWYHGPVSIAKHWYARDGYTGQHESFSFADKLCKGTRRPAIALCGHVHDAWLVQFDYEHGVLNVNVGLDVWGYKPVSDMQIIKILEFLKAQRIQKLDRPFTWKRADLERAMRENDRHVKNDRAQRKAEKHAKKGLTPEECERRKQAAMAKKKALRASSNVEGRIRLWKKEDFDTPTRMEECLEHLDYEWTPDGDILIFERDDDHREWLERMHGTSEVQERKDEAEHLAKLKAKD